MAKFVPCLIFFALGISVTDGATSPAPETTDLIRCPSQDLVLHQNEEIMVQAYKKERCSFSAHSPYDHRIIVTFLPLASWTIYDYVLIRPSGEKCLNQFLSWNGSSEKPCTLSLNCSTIDVNVSATVVLQVQFRQESHVMSPPDDNNEMQHGQLANLKIGQCENVRVFDDIFQMSSHYSFSALSWFYMYVFLTFDQRTDRKIDNYDHYYYDLEELPGFDIGLPENVFVSELPECPDICTCSLKFQMFITTCSNAPASQIMLAYQLFDLNSTALDASSRQITQVAPHTFSNLTDVIILLLSNNLLSAIDQNIFKGLQNLHTLDLSYNQISNIDAGSFAHVCTLQQLFLNRNKLTSISHSWFHDLVNVQVLNFGSNVLNEVELETDLKGLKVLSLYNCNLNQVGNLPMDLLLLDLSLNNLSIFPIDLPNNLTRFVLDSNQISSKNQVITSPGLISLQLSSNDIEHVSRNTFTDLYELELLDLRDNKLKTILYDDLFHNLTKLYELDLSNNSFESLPSGVFRNLHELRKLHLDGNRLKIIQEDLFYNIQLYSLDLSNNNIESLPSSVFRDLHELRRLPLDGNKLKIIQEDLFYNMTQLFWLDLSNNTIESLPSGVFRDLHELKHLHLDVNELKMIQEDLFYNLTKLYSLDLSKNNIESLPSGLFRDLKMLRLLYLSNNNIESLPIGVFRDLHKLGELFMDGNKLKIIQEDLFYNMTQLYSLDLSNNNIESLPSGLFRDLKMLRLLYLSNNNIGSLPFGVFRDLHKLGELFMDGNKLKIIQEDLFYNMTQLYSLDLSNNNIPSLPSGIFKHTPLITLSIAANKLNGVNADQFENLTNLKRIDLSLNEINQIQSRSFSGLRKLLYLNISENKLSKVTKKSFMGLSLLNNSYISVDNPGTCCFLELSNQSQCVPKNKKSPYLTCKQLLPTIGVKCCTWIFGFCALFANIVVIIWGRQKMKSQSGNEKQMRQIFFIINLAIADFLMGLYLLVIAFVDQYYNEYFPSYAENWRNSVVCKIVGFLSVLSSEASLSFLTLIALERIWVFRKALIVHKLFGKKKQLFGRKKQGLMSIFAWMIAIALSIAITTLNNDELYQFTDVCIGLPLVKSKTYRISYENVTIPQVWDISLKKIPDLDYAVYTNSTSFLYPEELQIQTYEEIGSQAGNFFSNGLFLGLNFLLCVTIAVCYIMLFLRICKSGFALLKMDFKLALKMGAISLTDLACWLPIVVPGILAQTGVKELPSEWIPWITTFVLPINSVLNPILYTTVGRLANRYVKRFQSTFYREVETGL